MPLHYNGPEKTTFYLMKRSLLLKNPRSESAHIYRSNILIDFCEML